MKSTAKQENKFNFKRNIYIPKMCVDLGPGGLQHHPVMKTDVLPPLKLKLKT